MDNIWNDLSPVLANIIITVVGGLLSIVLVRFQLWTGITISKARQDDLHRAAETGVRLAFEKGLPAAGTEMVEVALDYVRDSVPDALKHFGLDRFSPMLQKIVESKITKVREKL